MYASITIALVPLAAFGLAGAVIAAGARTECVSMAPDGAPGDGWSSRPVVSADGRYVAFMSEATNLVPGDTNRGRDIFVENRATRALERVSVTSEGHQAEGQSEDPAISGDGRFVAFASNAPNLAPDNPERLFHVFVHDRNTRQTERVSVASDGTLADRHCDQPAISADGRYVAFTSWASNLAPGGAGPCAAVFLHDRTAGKTERVSAATDGTPGNDDSFWPALNADGRYVAFMSYAGNLVAGDANGVADIFVRDRVAGTIERVSVATDGREANAQSAWTGISADGRLVVFASDANNLDPSPTGGVFVRDRVAGATERVSVATDGTPANRPTDSPAISPDGRYVAFSSGAANLVPDDTNNREDIFVRDCVAGTTERVSVTTDGTEADHWSRTPSISAGGRYVVFASQASNLAGRRGPQWAVFARTRE
ncbi:MAG: PD40 domain-containing protein [Armatimonadetes bacterium]|nr:PD40 domain-containing protein [Armatimonadota bacterium]